MSRLVRTIILGTLAAGAGIWWLGRAYEVESTRLVGFLISSTVLVAVTIIAAVLGGIALGWLRRRRYRRDTPSSFDVFRGRVKADRQVPSDP